MPMNRHPDEPDSRHSSNQPTDDFLVSSMLKNDEQALHALINRYDKLIRFTIFRTSKKLCQQDPQWLEMVASNTWLGFVQSMRRDPNPAPGNLAAYLARIARNQTLSALRSIRNLREIQQNIGVLEKQTDKETLESPEESMIKIEELETLKSCLAELNEDQQKLVSQLDSITQRRWKEAAHVLGMQEATLRSRWVRILERLKRCMKEKTGKSFAPYPQDSD